MVVVGSEAWTGEYTCTVPDAKVSLPCLIRLKALLIVAGEPVGQIGSLFKRLHSSPGCQAKSGACVL